MRVDIVNEIEKASSHVFYLSGRLECECGEKATFTIIDSYDNKPVMYMCDGCADKFRMQHRLM